MVLVKAVFAFALVGHVFTSPILDQEEQPAQGAAMDYKVCKGQATGALVPDPTCANCFYECDAGVGYQFHCPNNLIFTNGATRCTVDPNHPVEVPCLGSSRFDCHGKPDGYYPDATDRKRFHACDHGCGSDLACSPTTYWDSSRNVCAYDPTSQDPVTQAPVTQAPVTQHHETPAPVTQAPVHHDETTPTHWTPAPVTPPTGGDQTTRGRHN